MEVAPPSYEHSTLIDFWDIVARYMPSRDLTAAALVCRRWHSTFAPHIWGNPASHFGVENDRVYVALTRFDRNLKTARLLVRSLTHTLHLPPAHAEIYNGPHTDWLRDMLERLPNLQSLIVRGLPFFDHGALQALVFVRKKAVEDNEPPSGVIELPGSEGTFYQSPSTSIPSFGLRLLDASRCPNVTASALASALGRFESLLYLDLSFTYPARNATVLNTLRNCTGLQVLKLRGISLRDEGIETLCQSIGHRVRSLDVRENELTDRSVRSLLGHSFVISSPTDTGQRSPMLLPYLGAEMLEVYQGEDFEGYLRDVFTGRFVSRLAIEDAPVGGITHLYIAGNALTVEGVSGLVRTSRLHVLDVGTIPTSSAHGGPSGIEMPGTERLAPVFAKHAAESMTFLRIGHEILQTREPSHSHADSMVPGRVELDDTALPDIPRHAAELESTSFQPPTYEMPTEQQSPRYELPGDPMRFVISPAVDATSSHLTNFEGQGEGIRRGSAFAPEAVDEFEAITRQSEQESFLNPSSALPNGTYSSSSLASTTPESPGLMALPKTRPRSYSSMAMERKARIAAHKISGHTLHPAMLPHITTLVLTDVPPFSSNGEVAERIVCFIKNCAEEAAMARAEAKLDYALPPGRQGHTSALRHSANKLFTLKRLVLELAPSGVGVNGLSRVSPWQRTGPKSMSEDRDSERLWAASETDFSFFGEEECVFPTLDLDRVEIGSGADEKEVNLGQSAASLSQTSPRNVEIDNIAVISAFRKDCKLAHQRSLDAGNSEAETEGLWDGVVQVVRYNNALRRDEEMDYYGNMFTNNYLYR